MLMLKILVLKMFRKYVNIYVQIQIESFWQG